jgi:hypothetical protein
MRFPELRVVAVISFCKAKYYFTDSHCAYTKFLASVPHPVTGINPRDQR